MPQYLIYFNQQWVGDHTEEWFASRVEPSMAVIEEMRAAGVYVFAGGLEEDGPVVSADATSGRFAFDMSMTFPGADEQFAFSGKGAFDAASRRASFAVDMSAFAKLLGGFASALGGGNATDMPDFDDPAGWKIDVVQDGDVTYLRLPAIDAQLPSGKTWIRASESDAKAGGVDFLTGYLAERPELRPRLEGLLAAAEPAEHPDWVWFAELVNGGFYADAANGGNRGGVSWRMVD